MPICTLETSRVHVHLFLPGAQCELGQIPGKITALGEVETDTVQSALVLCRARAVPNHKSRQLNVVTRAKPF
jgi:hypothetical protein